MAVYMLGFNNYFGFSNLLKSDVNSINENILKRIYEYAKKLDQ